MFAMYNKDLNALKLLTANMERNAPNTGRITIDGSKFYEKQLSFIQENKVNKKLIKDLNERNYRYPKN